MKLSFDFDGTLERKDIQELARELIAQKHNVIIVTTRYLDTSRYGFKCSHNDLYEVADELGILEIHFTDMEYKWKRLKKIRSLIHIDDNMEEIRLIEEHCKCIPIYCGSKNWHDNYMEALTSLY